MSYSKTTHESYSKTKDDTVVSDNVSTQSCSNTAQIYQWVVSTQKRLTSLIQGRKTTQSSLNTSRLCRLRIRLRYINVPSLKYESYSKKTHLYSKKTHSTHSYSKTNEYEVMFMPFQKRAISKTTKLYQNKLIRLVRTQRRNNTNESFWNPSFLRFLWLIRESCDSFASRDQWIRSRLVIQLIDTCVKWQSCELFVSRVTHFWVVWLTCESWPLSLITTRDPHQWLMTQRGVWRMWCDSWLKTHDLWLMTHDSQSWILHTCVMTWLVSYRGASIIGCFIFIGHFLQKSPIISGSSAKNDLFTRVTWFLHTCDLKWLVSYRVASNNRMLYLYRSFSAKEPYT